MIELIVESVRGSLSTRDRLLMLRERERERYLPIKIGENEALCIAVALQKSPVARPLAPDLLKAVIQQLGARMTQVIVTDLVDETFHARLILDMQGRHIEVDARPSDAIALALRVQVPIYAEEGVMARAGYTPEPRRFEKSGRGRTVEQAGEPVDPAKLGAFADFIGSLDDLDELGKPHE
ncbi:MAG: bifunctional nuclease family protein [Chloroflexota bacterium]